MHQKTHILVKLPFIKTVFTIGFSQTKTPKIISIQFTNPCTRLIGKFPPKCNNIPNQEESKSNTDNIYENPSNTHSRTFKLKDDQVFLSIDYISNIPILEQENLKDAFFSPSGVTYFEVYQVHIVNGKRVRTSFPYIYDSKHKEWSAIGHILEQHMRKQINDLSTLIHYMFFSFSNSHSKNVQNCCINTTTIKTFHIWSDRAPNDCNNTAYMKSIAELSKKLKVQIIHNFTEPNHGKFTHDANGSVTKRAVNDGIRSGALDLTLKPDESTYASKIATFLNERFKESNKNETKMKRTITCLDFKNFSKPPFEHHRLQGIKSYYSFRTDPLNNKIVYYRRNTCYCRHCISCTTDGFARCINVASRGKWKIHVFKPKDDAINISYIPSSQSQVNNESHSDNDIDMGPLMNTTGKLFSKNVNLQLNEDLTEKSSFFLEILLY